MASQELERLLIRLEADTSIMRKALKDAEQNVEGFSNKVERSLSRGRGSFDKYEAAITRVAKQLVAFAVAQAGLGAAQRQLDASVHLINTAEAAGMTTQRVQELRAAMMSSGVATQQFDGALEKFAVKMGEVRARTGGFYKFLQDHVPTLATQLRQTKDQAEAFDVVTRAVARMGSAEDRALLVKQAFEESSVALTKSLTRLGSEGYAAAAKEAEKYNLVAGEEALQKTKELKVAFDQLSVSAGVRLTEALGSVAPAAMGLISFLQKADKDYAAYIASMDKGFKAQAPQINKIGMFAGNLAASGFLDGMQKKMADLKIETKLPPFTTTIDFSGADALNDLRVKVAEALGDTATAIDEEYANELERFRRLLAEKVIDEQDYAKARESLNIAMGAKIKAMYDEELRAARELAQDFTSTIESSVLGVLDDAIRGSSISWQKAGQDMLATLVRLTTQALILKPIMDALSGWGTGMLSNIVPGGNPGGRAAGGPITAGVPYMVGERGPEMIIPDGNAKVVPNHAMGGATTVYNIDARYADAGVEQRIYRALAEVERNRPSAVQQTRENAKRFPMRR